MATFRRIGKKVRGGVRRFGEKAARDIQKIGKKAVSTVAEGVKEVFGRPNKDIPNSVRKKARFAAMAYSGRRNFDGLRFDKSLSNDKRAVWVGDERVVVSFRGTVPSDREDLLDDIRIAVGAEGTITRATSGAEFIERIARDFVGSDIEITGHSLGGQIVILIIPKLSEAVVKKTDASVFNPGIAKPERFSNARNRRILEVYHIAGDPISVLARGIPAKTNQTYLAKRGLGPHTIRNFL